MKATIKRFFTETREVDGADDYCEFCFRDNTVTYMFRDKIINIGANVGVFGKAKLDSGKIVRCCPECAGMSVPDVVWDSARKDFRLKKVSLAMLGDRGHNTEICIAGAASTGATPIDEDRQLWDFTTARAPDRMWFHYGQNRNTGTDYDYYEYAYDTPHGRVHFTTGYDPLHERDGGSRRLY